MDNQQTLKSISYLGWAYLEIGQFENALKAYGEGAEFARPRLGMANHWTRDYISAMGICHEKLGQSDKAIATFQRFENAEKEMKKLQDEADRLGKSSFAFAFYMDTEKEERERKGEARAGRGGRHLFVPEGHREEAKKESEKVAATTAAGRAAAGHLRRTADVGGRERHHSSADKAELDHRYRHARA
jgi:tetratricopeptide (TPR) repeat protein